MRSKEEIIEEIENTTSSGAKVENVNLALEHIRLEILIDIRDELARGNRINLNQGGI